MTIEMLKTLLESLHYEVSVVRSRDGNMCCEMRVGQERVFPLDVGDAFTLLVSAGADNYLSLYTRIDQRRLDQQSRDWIAQQLLLLNCQNHRGTRVGFDKMNDECLVIAEVHLVDSCPPATFLSRQIDDLSRQIEEIRFVVSWVTEVVSLAEKEMLDGHQS